MLLPLLINLRMFTPPTAPPITYWDVVAMQPQSGGKKKKKQRKQELETMFLLLG